MGAVVTSNTVCIHSGNPGSYDNFYKKEFEFCKRFLSTYLLYRDSLSPKPDTFSSLEALYSHVKESGTRYVSKKDYAAFANSLTTLSDSAGAGLGIDTFNSFFIITDIVPNSPAARELKINDTIIAINDSIVSGYTLQKVLHYFTGKPNTIVTIKFKRLTEYYIVKLILNKFYKRSVYYRNDTFSSYIDIRTFATQSCTDSGTKAEFNSALQKTSSAPNTYIDLSKTSTGNYTVALALLNYFTYKGKPLITLRERMFDTLADSSVLKEKTILSQLDTGIAWNRKFAILIGDSTAGPAEVMVAGLRSVRPDIPIIGSKTKGYTRSQIVSPTPDSGAAVVTNGVYLTAEGIAIDGVGISP